MSWDHGNEAPTPQPGGTSCGHQCFRAWRPTHTRPSEPDAQESETTESPGSPCLSLDVKTGACPGRRSAMTRLNRPPDSEATIPYGPLAKGLLGNNRIGGSE